MIGQLERRPQHGRWLTAAGAAIVGLAANIVFYLFLLSGNGGYAYAQGAGCDVWWYYGLSLSPELIVSNDIASIKYQHSRLLLWSPVYFLESLSTVLGPWNDFVAVISIALLFLVAYLSVSVITRGRWLVALVIGLAVATSPYQPVVKV